MINVKVPYDETRIQLALFNHLMAKQVYAVIPNVSWSLLAHEADLVSITKAFYLYEWEIKISYSDFIKDFTKTRKHRDLRCGFRNRYCTTPNYFSYVAPADCYPLCVPDYAGIYIAERSRYGIRIVEVRRPKPLHKNKLGQEQVMAVLRTLMFKYFQLAQTLDQRKVQKSLFTQMESAVDAL